MIAGVADYLTANGGSTDCLAGLFAEWDMPSDGTPSCVAADLDGDGENEYVVRLVRKPAGGEGSNYFPDWLLGKILIFDRTGGGFSPVFDLKDFGPTRYEERLSENPVIYSVTDVNRDARPEVFLTTSECGAHTCHLYVYAVAYRSGLYVSIVADSASGPSILVPMADNQLRIEDIDGDGTMELLLRQGLIASAGAGPQREATRRYKWDGKVFALASVEYDAANYQGYSLYYLNRDADDAFTRREYSGAAALYLEALDQPDLPAFYTPGNSGELRAYARFRIGLSLAAMGDGPSALAALDRTVAADPAALHSLLAQRFRDAYAPASDLVAGCAGALTFVDENADAFARLWNYGYANPNPGAEKLPLCPF